MPVLHTATMKFVKDERPTTSQQLARSSTEMHAHVGLTLNLVLVSLL